MSDLGSFEWMMIGLCRVQATFILQDGECGQKEVGLTVLLNSHDFSHYKGSDYFSNVIVPMMVNRFMEDINQMMIEGKLWEGAYLTTHPDDIEVL